MVQGYESEATGQSPCVGNVNLVGRLVGERQRRASDSPQRGIEWIVALRRATLQMKGTSRLFQGVSIRLCGVLVCEQGLKRGQDRQPGVLCLFVAVRVFHFVDLELYGGASLAGANLPGEIEGWVIGSRLDAVGQLAGWSGVQDSPDQRGIAGRRGLIGLEMDGCVRLPR